MMMTELEALQYKPVVTDLPGKLSSAVPIKPVLSKIKVCPGKPSSPEIQRIPFPINLAWACTVHKVQGLTLHNVVISFN